MAPGHLEDAGAAIARAERIRRDALHRDIDGASGLQRGRQTARALGLDTDDAHPSAEPRGDAANQSTTADGDEHGVEWRLLLPFKAHRSLTGHGGPGVIRMNGQGAR